MLIEELHYQVRQKMNKLDSGFRRDFTDPEIDDALNEASLMFLHNLYSEYQNRGVEYDNENVVKLRPFIITFPTAPAIQPTSTTDNVYRFILPTDFLYPLRVRIKSDSCPNEYITVSLTTHDELDALLSDYHYKPSLKWKRALAVIGYGSSNQHSLYVYTNGEFTADDLYIDYIKKPATVSIGGYDDILGTPKAKIESDISSEYHFRLVDFACTILHGIIENPNGLQVSLSKLNMS
jgi:hypothetical protein